MFEQDQGLGVEAATFLLAHKLTNLAGSKKIMTMPVGAKDIETSGEAHEASDQPLVIFTRSGIEAHWEPLCGTLLGFARALGLDPNSSCSQGMCGCCATKILSGAVDYIDEPLHGEPEGKALLCYTVPSKSHKGATLRLDL